MGVSPSTAFYFTGGLVFDTPGNTSKNSMLANMANLNNVIGAAQVLVAQQKRQTQDDINAAFGDKMSWSIDLPDSPLTTQDYATAKEEIQRILSTLRADHPARPGFEAMLRQIETEERLAAFRARLLLVSKSSEKSLSLMDRMQLQTELNMVKSELLLDSTARSAESARELMDVRNKRLDARKNIEDLKQANLQFR